MARRRTGFQDTEVRIAMPREYSDHPLCRQLTMLMDEEALKDVELVIGVSGRVERMSGFLLSLLSPVWHRTLVHGFSNGRELRMEILEDEVEALKTVVALGCGGGGAQVLWRGLDDLLGVGQVADKYQVDEVRRVVEEEALKHLKLETCAKLLTACERSGLRELEEACRRMALAQYFELTRTEGFMGMGEETLRSLLVDDELECVSEVAIFEGLVKWMSMGGEGELRGEGLLESIRFPFMPSDYLMSSARSALGGSERLKELVSEALEFKSLPAEERSKHIKYLGGKALRKRVGRGVRWGEYQEGGRKEARRLPDMSARICCLADCGDWVCGGHHGNGTITVWNKASLEVKRTLIGHRHNVYALAVHEAWLLSGSWDYDIRVWDVEGGQCLRAMEGHTSAVHALAVSDGMLLSSSSDETIRVWKLEGAPSTWRCVRTLAMDNDNCCCLTWWEGKVVSRCDSGAVGVWDLSTGECVKTMQGYGSGIDTLVGFRRGHLISSSSNKRVRVWCLESGKCVTVKKAWSDQSYQYIQCLAVSGRKLLLGSRTTLEGSECEVVVWDLRTWEEEQWLLQPAGRAVYALLAMDGEVWGAVDKHLVVWGRED